MEHKTVIFDLRGAAEPRLPVAPICGLPALVRTMLALQRADDGGGDGRGELLYRRAVLLVPAAERAALEQALRCERVKMELCWVEDDSDLVDPLLDEGVLEPELRQLLYWPGELTFGRFAPQLASAEAREHGALAAGDTGLTLFAAAALQRGESFEETRRRLEAQELLELRELEPQLQPVLLREPADLRRAEDALLVSLRKAVDGVVAKYDRYISLAISRHLMKFSVSPSVITVMAGLLGVGCGVLAAQGTYLTLLAAALLFQANSILDGIDGEIARAKLLESRTGQWLDTISDDLSNLCFFVGAAVGCWRYWDSQLYLYLGAATGIGFLISQTLQYHYIITVARSGDLNKFKMPWEEDSDETEDLEHDGSEAERPGLVSRALASLKFVVRRDTFTFLCTLAAIAGQLRIMVWFIALGATVVWISIVGYRYLLPLFRRPGGESSAL